MFQEKLRTLAANLNTKKNIKTQKFMKKVLIGVAIIVAMIAASGIYVYAQDAKTKKVAQQTEVTKAEAPNAEADKTEASCCSASASVPACCAAKEATKPACCAAHTAATPACCEVDKVIAEKKTVAQKK